MNETERETLIGVLRDHGMQGDEYHEAQADAILSLYKLVPIHAEARS